MLKLTVEEAAFVEQMEQMFGLGEWTYKKLSFYSIQEIKDKIKHLVRNTAAFIS